MRKTKEAALVLQHQNGSGQQTTLPEFDMSMQNHITGFAPAQGSAASFLGYGHRNALTTREISRNSGLNSRDVTGTTCYVRRQGAPILSGPGVEFWITETKDEVHRCVTALRRRAAEIKQTAQALDRTAGGG